MARLEVPGNDALYDMHHRWLADVLPAGDSLLVAGTSVWTDANLDALERYFIGQPDAEKHKSFLDKLHDQVGSAPPEAIQLMAELHVVHFLHIWNGAISAAKKRHDIEVILSWMPTPVGIGPDVTQTFEPGFVHPGQWVLTRRDTQITWLIYFSRAWRALGEARRAELLADPWGFKAFVFDVEAPSADGARLSMMHMTHPEAFEAIVSTNHKEQIARRFSSLASGAEDVDRRILEIRAALTPEFGASFDWYADVDVHLRWSRAPKSWRPFLTWIERCRAAPDFDERERTYKLDLGELIAAARDAAQRADVSWIEPLRTAFKDRRNNLTRWNVHDRFLRVCRDEPVDSLVALQQLWSDVGAPVERFDRFVRAMPAGCLTGPGARLNIGSYLLMGENPIDLPIMKISLLKRAFRLVAWPAEDGASATDVYRRGLLLFGETAFEGGDWPLPIRDRLDAQGAIWMLLNLEERPATWPDEWWTEFLDYRASALGSGISTADDDEDVIVDDVDEGDALTPKVDYIEEAAKRVHVGRAHLDEIVQLLDDKGQVVFYGPPGTGKTFVALELARAIAEGDEQRVSIVQFHPATTYEDFIEGLRPRLTDAGQVTYEVTPGPLVRIAEAARMDSTHHYVLVVDEINRANLPKVFGELLFLLEYRSESAHTVHRPETTFTLPANLWIIGTMNTADRSIALIDAAMRRRFHFVPFFPHEGAMKGLLGRWLKARGGRQAVAQLLDAVNDELRADMGDHLLIGPSHFMRVDLSEAALERIWTYNVFPLIEEQFWGDRDAITRWRWDSVRRRYAHLLDGASQGEDPTPSGQLDEPVESSVVPAVDEVAP